LNVKINLPNITDKKFNDRLLAECKKMATEGDKLLASVLETVEKKL
jgi:formiminotetrahydrofolate cyclodeaminase